MLSDSSGSSNCYSYYAADSWNPGILVLVLGIGYIVYYNYFDLVDNILSVKKLYSVNNILFTHIYSIYLAIGDNYSSHYFFDCSDTPLDNLVHYRFWLPSCCCLLADERPGEDKPFVDDFQNLFEHRTNKYSIKYFYISMILPIIGPFLL